MPVELKMKILEKVDKREKSATRLVCKEFADIQLNFMCFKYLYYNCDRCEESLKKIAELPETAKRFSDVRIDLVDGGREDFFNDVYPDAENKKGLADFLSGLPGIKEFCFKDPTNSQQVEVADDKLPSCENLVQLEIPQSVANIFVKATKLRYLYLVGPLNETLLTNNSCLNELHIQFDENTLIPPALNGSFPSVKELSVETSSKMTFGPELKKLVESFPSVQKLVLKIRAELTIDLSALLKSLKELTQFELSTLFKHLATLDIGLKLTTVLVINNIYVYSRRSRILRELKTFMSKNKHVRSMQIRGDIGTMIIKEILSDLNLKNLKIVMSRRRFTSFNEEAARLLCESNLESASVHLVRNFMVRVIRRSFALDCDIKKEPSCYVITKRYFGKKKATNLFLHNCFDWL